MKLITLRRKIAESKLIGRVQTLLRKPDVLIALHTVGNVCIATASALMWLIVATAIFELLGLTPILVIIMLIVLWDSFVRAVIRVDAIPSLETKPVTVTQGA